jgi:hypothetical protein
VFQAKVGPLGTVHAFHEAGFATGAALLPHLTPRLSAEPSETDEGIFWRELAHLFEERGWGSLTHERIHPGLAILRSGDWTEASSSDDESPLGCAFSSGVLAHLLGAAAGSPVGVLEVSCRGRGDPECAFVFGSEGAVHDLYGLLLDGKDLEAALERV